MTAAETHQSVVIAALTGAGHNNIAERMARCQHERQHRRLGSYPWRCRSAGCWACPRTITHRWWRAFQGWIVGAEISLAIIPLPSDPFYAIRKLRKDLRDVRDRAAQRDRRFSGMALAGLLDEDRVLVLVQHAGIALAGLWEMLERRWPEAILTDPSNIEPSSAMTTQDAAALAVRRRGIQPLRIVVLPQIAASDAAWDEPMPLIV